MAPVETRLRVRYAETDQMGVVYHANYLIWMEVGRVEYWRAAGLRYRDMEREDGVLLVVAEVNCRYLSAAVYDEEVIVRTSVAEVSPRMIRTTDASWRRVTPSMYSAAQTADRPSCRKNITKH
jgi:acyl-CoA thioester hydrolase